MSYIQGQVWESQGSHWVRQGWSIATRKRCEKVKKRKRPRKARRWLQRRQGSMCPKPRFFFFGSRVFGFGSGPSRLKYWLLQDLVYKEAMCEGSSGNGLLYAVKAVPYVRTGQRTSLSGNRVSLKAIPATKYSVVTISHKINPMTTMNQKWERTAVCRQHYLGKTTVINMGQLPIRRVDSPIISYLPIHWLQSKP